MELSGQILYYLAFLNPLITIPLVWKFRKGSKVFRIVLCVAISLIVWYLLLSLSVSVAFREGMGP